MMTISNSIITSALAVFLFAGVALALAQDSTELTGESETESVETTQVERQERIIQNQEARDERQETRAGAMEVRQGDRSERRAQLEIRTQERITNLAANMSNRIDAVISRIQNIINRLTTRIDKLSDGGVDTSEAKTSLVSAQSYLDLAKAEIANIDETVVRTVSAEDARTAWAAVRVKITLSRDYLRESHNHLRATVADLKKAVADSEKSVGVSDAVRANLGTNTETSE